MRVIGRLSQLVVGGLGSIVVIGGLFQRKRHVVRFREAIGWTLVWMALAALFAILLHRFGQEMAADTKLSNGELSLQFITGYVIELSLSVDNLFVFLLLFRFFHIPGELQRRVLTWGIIGALIMRAVFIWRVPGVRRVPAALRVG